jgi:hypothetical protein
MAQDADPPSRVARLNYVSGPVSFRPGSVDEWTAATLNYPLTTGDHLWADAGARAEMHIGSTAIRMDSTTAMSILALDDAVAQISLTEGTIDVRLRYMVEGDTFEVDTPNAAIVLRRAGDYRISTRGDENLTMAAAKAGEASVRAGDTEFPLLSGQSAQLAGQDTVTEEMGSVPAPDDFDVWCQTRDRREAGMVSARYVPRETIGYEDLDQYGVWRMDARYGWVWVPQGLPAGWAPYHYGHWAWVEPWGWTWIDDAPWGFAPFHYGRWAFADAGWVWLPGSMDAAVGMVRMRPVYAPALVVFVGGGEFGVGAALGGGAGMAAWFPLGPGEVYRPAYRVSAAYVNNINIVSVRNVTVIGSVDVVNVRYANQAVPGAMMVVPHDAFVSSRRVSEVAVVVPREQIVRARVIGSTAPMAPVRESVLGRPSGGAVVRVPPQSLAARQVVVSHQPPPPPVRFADKERALQSNGGRPLDAGQANSLRRSAPDRNPMVRTPNPPAGGGARRPEAVRPEVNRPPGARPTVTPQPERQPEARPAEARPNEARPAVTPQPVRQPEARPAEARPNEARPAVTPQPVRQPEARPAEARPNEAKPAVTPQPVRQPEARPAEQKPNEPAPAAHPNDQKAPPRKRSEQTQKK